MKRKYLLVWGVVVLLALTAIAGWNVSVSKAEVKNGIAVGNRALDFELSDLDGKTVRLGEIVEKNQVTIVNFWATWCPPCRGEIPDLIRFNQRYSSAQVAILAVNLQEEPAQVQNFAKKSGMNFTILTDTKGKVAKIYNVYAIPTTLIIDKKGIVCQIIEGATTFKALESEVKKVL